MIRKSVLLPCAPGQAFALFTERITEWWPPDHRPTRDSESRLFLTEAGRFWEQDRGGREVELGRVQVWEAPHRLVLSFYLGTDAAHPTEVEVGFTPEAGGTRVTVTHRPTPLSEDLWTLRAQKFDRSWEALLAALTVTTVSASP